MYNGVKELRAGFIYHPSTDEEVGQMHISRMGDWSLATLELPLHSPFQKYLNFMEVGTKGAFILIKFKEIGKKEKEFIGLRFFWALDCDEQKVGVGCEVLEKLDNLQVVQMVQNKRVLGLAFQDITQIEGYTDEQFMKEWDRTTFDNRWPYAGKTES